MARWGTGYVADPEGHCRTPFDRLRGMMAAAPSAGADLSRFAPKLDGVVRHFDQGQTGSCTGHSVSAVIVIVFGAASLALDFIPSPQGIYTVGRCVDRTQNPDGSWPALQDGGAMPNQVVRGVKEFGVRPIRSATLQLQFSDADPATVNDEPKLDELEQDQKTLVTGEYGIFTSGSARARDVALALDAGLAVAVAINGGCDAFQRYTSGVLTGSALAGQLDHYVAVVAHVLQSNGKRLFKIWNSWGDRLSNGWGDDGCCWIDESGLDTLGDLYVFVPKKG